MKTITLLALLFAATDTFASCPNHSYFQDKETSVPEKLALSHSCSTKRGEICVYRHGAKAVVNGVVDEKFITSDELFRRSVSEDGGILELNFKTKLFDSLSYSRSMLFELHLESGTAFLEYKERGFDRYEGTFSSTTELHLRCKSLR